MTQVILERVRELERSLLDTGSHMKLEDGGCAMEWASYLAGEEFTEEPDCVSEILRALTIEFNDTVDDEERQKLKPLLPLMVGTADDGLDDERWRTIARILVSQVIPWILTQEHLSTPEIRQQLRDTRSMDERLHTLCPVGGALDEAAQAVRESRSRGASVVDGIARELRKVDAGAEWSEVGDWLMTFLSISYLPSEELFALIERLIDPRAG